MAATVVDAACTAPTHCCGRVFLFKLLCRVFACVCVLVLVVPYLCFVDLVLLYLVNATTVGYRGARAFPDDHIGVLQGRGRDHHGV